MVEAAAEQAWAASYVRRFARATNLLLAGRTFDVVGDSNRAEAITQLLQRFGCRRVGITDAPDYLWIADETPITLDDVAAFAETKAGRPLVVIANGARETWPGLQPTAAPGISSTSWPNVVVVQPDQAPADRSVVDAAARIDWARQFMPVTSALAAQLSGSATGVRIAVSMVLEPKTAVLALALRDAGAEVSVFAHPDETDDAVADELRSRGLVVFANSAATPAEHLADALAFLDGKPDVLVDDGSHLLRLAHELRPELVAGLLGATEETTSGLRPLRAMERAGELRVPVIAVNDARSKTLFDNRFGTGQSVVFAIADLLDTDLAGKRVAVVGFGPVGTGVAQHAAALGADIVVAEHDSARALQAQFDGYEVLPLLAAVASADIVISATGVADTLSVEVMRRCRADAVLAVAGGVPQEIAIDAAVAAGASRTAVADRTERFAFPDGTSVLVLDDGGCINITAGEGNPIEIMDLSFAVQLGAIRYLLENRGELDPGVHPLPHDIDESIARLALGPASASSQNRPDSTSATADWHTTRFERGQR